MGYRVQSFEGRNLSGVARDLQSFLNRTPGIKVISVTHSSHSLQGGEFYSALLVYEMGE